jgi:phospholipase/lecithinase/hemolysin
MNRLVASVVAAIVLASPVLCQASFFTSFFVFGDSLSDDGRAAILSGGQFPPTPSRRFSNGPVAAEYLAGTLGVPLAPATPQGGTDFAVGGATTGTANFNFVANSPDGVGSISALEHTGIAAQISDFQAASAVFDPGRALFMVWGGPDDIFLAQALGQDPATAILPAVQNLTNDVALLASLGAERFLVLNMPNLGDTPGFRGTPDASGLAELVAAFNGSLALAMANLESQLGPEADITLFDTAAAFHDLLETAAAFGFTNTTDPCIPVALATNCAGYVFWDGFHPTTAAHALLAAELADVLGVPAPSAIVVLLVAGAGLALRGHVRTARRRAEETA